MSDLVGNPKDWFSHVAAHLIKLSIFIFSEEDMMETLREKEREEPDMEENMPSSLMLLNVSHDYLGR